MAARSSPPQTEGSDRRRDTASPPARVRLDVRDFGARGDGIHDDRAAIESAQRALPPDGGTLFFPAGVYAVGGAPILLRRSHLRLEGEGARSVLRKIRPGGALLATSPREPGVRELLVRGLRFEFDLPPPRGSPEVAIQLGHGAKDVAIVDSEFWDVRDYAVLLRSVSGAIVDGCRFGSPGAARGTGVQVEGASRRILVRDSSFRYLRKGIVVAAKPSRGEAVRDVTVERNHFDLGWWTMHAIHANEGASVRYGESSLVDPATAFSDLELRRAPAGLQHDVRVLPVLRRGTGRFTPTTLRDDAADFVAARVKAGEILRTERTFALVAGVDSPTQVRVEEWLSRASYLPVEPPADGSAYVLYGVYLGRGARAFGSSLELHRWAGWFDLDGHRVVPAAGTRYEILGPRPDYPCHAEGGAARIAVRDNVFRRGWSDQVSVFGDEATIVGNRIESGQDMGVTVHGRGNRVARNRIRHQGASGIWARVRESVIEDNRVGGSGWVNPQAHLGDVTLREARDTVVARNACERLVAPREASPTLRPPGRDGRSVLGLAFPPLRPGRGVTGARGSCLAW